MKHAANDAEPGPVKFRMSFPLKVAFFFLLAGAFLLALLLIRHAWFYSGQVLGGLKVSHAPFSAGRNMYELSVAGKVTGHMSELDTWYIENQYAYGTAAAGKEGGTAYFIFNCQTSRYEPYSDQDAFRSALAEKGLPWRNFMSGENIVAMKYNQRMFSSQCPEESGTKT